jgi:hypothetical protein
MTGTVEILRLSGQQEAEALQTASALLADRSRTDLSRLLILDDTASLTSHAAAFERLLTSHRLDHLLCVMVGPRVGDYEELRLPGSISGGRGSAVLWVSDPIGVDWELAASAIAMVHSASTTTGLHHLIEVLSAVEVFDRVCEVAVRVPGGVASPGLRLSGGGTEASSFAAALAVAIRLFTEPQPGLPPRDDEPYETLLGDSSGTADLADGGDLSACRERVSAAVAAVEGALTRLAGTGGLSGAGQFRVRENVTATGEALAGFRDRVTRLLNDAHAPGGITGKQLDEVTKAGVVFPGHTVPPAGSLRSASPGASTVHQAIAESIRAGDPLPRVSNRLTLTESRMDSGGSASYLADVDRACPDDTLRKYGTPPALPPPQPWLLAAGALGTALGALAGAAWGLAGGIIVGVVIALAWCGIIAQTTRLGSRPGRERVIAALVSALAGVAVGVGAGQAVKPARTAAIAVAVLALVIFAVIVVWSWRARVRAWRQALAPEQAHSAADALANLVIKVAAREWSGRSATLDEVTRARIAVDGVSRELRDHADRLGDPWSSGPRAARAARLGAALLPALRDLALAVLPATADAPGSVTFDQARERTAALITEWTRNAHEHGVLSPPPFPSHAPDATMYADDAEMAEITEAVLYDPHDQMWQLCAAEDLGTLDVSGQSQVVAFASRLVQQTLAGALPKTTVWTSSEKHAGLLRLVPLRAGIVSTSWSDEIQQEPLP